MCNHETTIRRYWGYLAISRLFNLNANQRMLGQNSFTSMVKMLQTTGVNSPLYKREENWETSKLVVACGVVKRQKLYCPQ